ncbi:JNK-interacting protein 1 isoform X1 [Episyrphus balteatus]|uniref:JNK-interacting protein 1 isoform X1 n=1 Tax=Episyrphus balteatus TaxID=286459 RepID=UPI0024862F07|nr:JNK-interacting protein 1 isoform X1 [Episyrphus balteatus]XP_055845428.1 JNK-interacting protein 1 isoform X1 [Episyrphus balteatus]
MADSEFEEFRRPFEQIPTTNYTKNNTQSFYSLIPNDDLEDSPSSKSDSSDMEDGCDPSIRPMEKLTKTPRNPCQVVEDDEMGDGLKMISKNDNLDASFTTVPELNGFLPPVGTQRRRRKLPEIPKNKKSSILHLLGQMSQMSLADEMQSENRSGGGQTTLMSQQFGGSANQRTFLSLKCGYLLDEDSSPDSERLQSLGDVDSGHSTAHSPNDFKSMSPQMPSPVSQSPFPTPFGGVPFGQLEMLEATHRGLHKFIPRHHDEIEVEIGDAIYVQKEADDLWCEGVNIRTGRQGIFPSAYAVDLDYNDFDPTAQQVKKERYLLGYLGSVETLAHKGTGVVCQAVRKIVGEYGNSPTGQVCILEVSDQGLRMVDRSGPKTKKDKKPCIDYFYSLKNVSFCAFHPRDHRFIGFITKHPTVQRFACHVFKGSESTRPVAEAVGRAFQRFYQKFIETAYPIEDIYIE